MAVHQSSSLPRRRRPVHMPPVGRHNMPVVLFVTIAVRPRIPVLANRLFYTCFLTAMQEADGWRTASHVVMPDHIHMFCVPCRQPAIGIKAWSEFLKRRTSFHLGPHPAWRWLPDCWDTQIRSRTDYETKRSYVLMNPVRAGLAKTTTEWPWQGEGAPVAW